MARRLRKVRHLRGSRTHGWGTSGQHRASGMRGGYGRAGRYRHKRSSLIRSGEFRDMHYEGKKGFIPISAKKGSERTLNLWTLGELVDRLVAEKKAQMVGDKVVVDLKQLGYEKVLGAGMVSRAIQVNVKCSETAAKKLKEAGGEIVTGTEAK